MINIVLFGAPGCGKGTQAQRLKAHYGIEHVSTGEVIRDEIRRGTELGRSMESYIKAGKLAPDQIVIGMIANYVAEHKHAKGCIFDGFPRTTVQAEEFDKILAGHGLQVDIMIDIHVPEEELIQRILLRGKDSGRADDASEEVIRGRLDVYRQQTAVVSDYYAAQGKYASVNGTGTMDDVIPRITDDNAQLYPQRPPQKKHKSGTHDAFRIFLAPGFLPLRRSAPAPPPYPLLRRPTPSPPSCPCSAVLSPPRLTSRARSDISATPRRHAPSRAPIPRSSPRSRRPPSHGQSPLHAPAPTCGPAPPPAQNAPPPRPGCGFWVFFGCWC